MAPTAYDIKEWISQNEKFFAPPICNKLMYKDGQLKCFFVGGPNQRKDFHMEEGEEFFYMLKGDMNLVVVEQGKFKDVIIKEGEVFLLPARIPHSPQRYANTMGLVIERERLPNEMDCLRYYVVGEYQILHEQWFHCDSLDEQLPPLIQEFFASEEYRTGKPVPGSIKEDKPVKQDFDRVLDEPFSLRKWLETHKDDIKKEGKRQLFDGNYSSRVFVLGEGVHSQDEDFPETFLWQVEGCATIENNGEVYDLKEGSTMLINEGEKWRLENLGEKNITLSVVMKPRC